MSQRQEKYTRRTEGELVRHGQRLTDLEDEVMGLRIGQTVTKETMTALERSIEKRVTVRVGQEMRRYHRNMRAYRWETTVYIAKWALAVIVIAGLGSLLLNLITGAVVTAAVEKETSTFTATASPAIDITQYADHLELINAVAITPATVEEAADGPYILEAVPLSAVYQITMQEACAQYNCPYSLALAVAEVETNFDMDAVGAVGEVGLMQLNPGPDNAYFEELTQAIGVDPAEYTGNIIGACYILGCDLASYDGDAGKAAMAYNMGRTGATTAWASGIYSTEYSEAVLEAADKWENIIAIATSGTQSICGG